MHSCEKLGETATEDRWQLAAPGCFLMCPLRPAASLTSCVGSLQCWVFANQLFTALDIATQSLVAFYLGRGDRRTAAAVFNRTLSLSLVAGVAMCGLLLSQQKNFPAVFSKDPAVVAATAASLPLIAAFLPLDAAASVMDGVLLAAQKAEWMSKVGGQAGGWVAGWMGDVAVAVVAGNGSGDVWEIGMALLPAAAWP